MEDMGMTDKFPSPFGVRVLKSLSSAWDKVKGFGSFPSPFGVRVLKLGFRTL